MTMKADLNRLVPLGLDGRREFVTVLCVPAAAFIAAALCCAAVYLSAYDDMFISLNGVRLPAPDAVFPSCAAMAVRSLPFFGAAALFMLYKLARYVSCHYQGGRSIYTMRRLPQRSELPVRCLCLPLGGCAACALLSLAFSCLFCAVYFAVTPADWARPGHWGPVLRLILGG